MAAPKTIDQYLSQLSADKRAALQRVRKIVRATAPGVEESISYQMPTFKLDGKPLIYMGAATNHCAIYGIDGWNDIDLTGYDTSGKGTVRFAPDEPLPEALIKKVVKARMAKIHAKGKSKSKSKNSAAVRGARG